MLLFGLIRKTIRVEWPLKNLFSLFKMFQTQKDKKREIILAKVWHRREHWLVPSTLLPLIHLSLSVSLFGAEICKRGSLMFCILPCAPTLD
jgi:hypothetical protein